MSAAANESAPGAGRGAGRASSDRADRQSQFSASPTAVHVATLASERAPVSGCSVMAWADLSTMLSTPTVGEKTGAAWMPADIDPGPRTAARVRSVSALVLDVEGRAIMAPESRVKTLVGIDPPEPSELAAEIGLWGWRSIVHKTYTHHDPAIMPADVPHPRYRVILAVSRPLVGAEVREIGEHVAGMLGIHDCTDLVTLEPARLSYLPRVPADRMGDYRHHDIACEPVDVDAILAQAAAQADAVRRASSACPSPKTGSVITEYCVAHDVGEMLTAHGYIPRGRDRWVHPDSTTGMPGVRLLPDGDRPRVFSSHGCDPLADGHAHDAYDVYRILDHGGDHRSAVREAAKVLGMDAGSARTRPDPDLEGRAMSTKKPRPRRRRQTIPTTIPGDLVLMTDELAAAAEARRAETRGQKQRRVDAPEPEQGAEQGPEQGPGPGDADMPEDDFPGNADALDDIGGDSEHDLAVRFIDRHQELRHVAPWKKWLVWDGSVWSADATMVVFSKIRRSLSIEANQDPGRRRTLLSAKTVAAVERLAESDRRAAATTDQWDRHDGLINTLSGLVDLRTGDILSHAPDAFATKITAAGPSGECPRWDRFLKDIAGADADLIAFLQRMAGYAATGFTVEHAQFFLYGTGANGKGVFLNTLTSVLSDYATVAPMETFCESNTDRHPTELDMLRGARLVVSQETDEGRRWAESRIKSLTGGDPITARGMRQDFTTFIPKFKLLIAGNHKPRLRNVDEAMRRRLHLVPFTVTIPPERRDKNLSEALKAEAPGIMRWIVAGAVEYFRLGLAPPAAVAFATNEYFGAEDIFAQWIADDCDRGPTFWEPTGLLFQAWKHYAEAANTRAGDQRAFNSRMESAGFRQVNGNGKGRHWPGICVRSTTFQEGAI